MANDVSTQVKRAIVDTLVAAGLPALASWDLSNEMPHEAITVNAAMTGYSHGEPQLPEVRATVSVSTEMDADPNGAALDALVVKTLDALYAMPTSYEGFFIRHGAYTVSETAAATIDEAVPNNFRVKTIINNLMLQQRQGDE